MCGKDIKKKIYSHYSTSGCILFIIDNGAQPVLLRRPEAPENEVKFCLQIIEIHDSNWGSYFEFRGEGGGELL